jgi:hypothetical protein
MSIRALSLWVKQLGREADYSPPSDKAMNVLLPFVTIYLWKLGLLLLLCHEKYIDRG